MTFRSDLSDRPVLDGGTNTQGGPLGATQYKGADNVIYLPVTSSRPANLPLPAALYSRGEPPLKLSEFAQTSLDVLALFVWLVLPVSLWGAVGLLGWVLFFA